MHAYMYTVPMLIHGSHLLSVCHSAVNLATMTNKDDRPCQQDTDIFTRHLFSFTVGRLEQDRSVAFVGNWAKKNRVWKKKG